MHENDKFGIRCTEVQVLVERTSFLDKKSQLGPDFLFRIGTTARIDYLVPGSIHIITYQEMNIQVSADTGFSCPTACSMISYSQVPYYMYLVLYEVVLDPVRT